MVRFFMILLGLVCVVGCATHESSFSRNETPAGVGIYSRPPAGYISPKPTMGVLEFKDKTGNRNKGVAAADQLTTLWVKSKRFTVVERTRLKDILKEQNMEGIVRPGEIPPAGEVRGCRYLCYGSVTDFEIKTTNSRKGGGFLRGITRAVGVPVLDFDFSKSELFFHIGIDVRIVDTTTGEIVFAELADVKRTETAKGMGLGIAGIDVSKSGSVKIDNKNQGRLLRLALDEVVKKLLPEIDNTFRK